ncbi:divalent-cation tolerance protein CutA [Qingshengfaniella alkalisoli]|uniref:Divalent-cation tolerance protein CutA n=1 Tax=Qingshengfaniella alkalisoli TaxID=2599296 RepID=A0A5B8J663_9RHOB|nr:divalent-cation tolerance protein CutA [Qingshengfaniella alkalisoli]QDY69830.1 divalent-cation tolerance protein CutA [Qingshengfaniella alkalisoli]
MTDDSPIALKVACPDTDIARTIASAAVGAGLAACGNIIPGVESVFQWQGKVERESEVLLWLTTRTSCLDRLVPLIRKHHPYDLPAITWSITGAEPETADWIKQTTR